MSAVDLKSPLHDLGLDGSSGRAGEAVPRASSLPAAEAGTTDSGVLFDGDEDEDEGYTVEHLSAVIRPVALTMILARCASPLSQAFPLPVLRTSLRNS